MKLQQKQTFYTHSKRNRKMAIKTLACVSGEPVGAQVSYVRTEIMLAIPSSTSLTTQSAAFWLLITLLRLVPVMGWEVMDVLIIQFTSAVQTAKACLDPFLFLFIKI